MDEVEYRKLAAVEDRMWYFAALHALIDAELTKRLGNHTAKILDAGCGTGGLIRRLGLNHPSWEWTGVDISRVALTLARRLSRPSTAEADCSTPGTASKPASQSIPPGAAKHGANRGAERKKNSSESAPGGRLLGGGGGRAPDISVGHAAYVEASLLELPFPAGTYDAVVSADVLYHIADDNAALRELRRVLRPGGTLIVNLPAHPWLWSYHDVAVGGLRRYRRGGLRRQLSEAGFAPQRLTHWNSLLLPLIAARRKLLPPPAAGSDVQEFSLPLELLGRGATALERAWLQLAPLPFGSSLFAVAG